MSRRPSPALLAASGAAALLLVACSQVADSTPATTADATAPIAASTAVATDPPATAAVATSVPVTTAPVAPTSTSTVPATAPPTSAPVVRPQAFVVPVADAAGTSWSDTHAAYPATDLFVRGGCGGGIVSPTDGVVLEVRTVDSYDPAVDDPATRGGRSVAILGDDGVRYYLAHFDRIEPAVQVGVRVAAGDALGTVGETGRTSACHVHFAISPPCPQEEWAVRRGVVWPYPYLDAWRAGEALSPADEVARFVAEHPTACEDAAAGIAPEL